MTMFVLLSRRRTFLDRVLLALTMEPPGTPCQMAQTAR